MRSLGYLASGLGLFIFIGCGGSGDGEATVRTVEYFVEFCDVGGAKRSLFELDFSNAKENYEECIEEDVSSTAVCNGSYELAIIQALEDCGYDGNANALVVGQTLDGME